MTQMGIGLLGNNTVVFSSKVRCVIEGVFEDKILPQTWVKLSPYWEKHEITFRILDYKLSAIQPIYEIISETYDLSQNRLKDFPGGNLNIKKFNSVGQIIEEYQLEDVYFKSVNFGGCGDTDTLELTVRYGKLRMVLPACPSLDNLTSLDKLTFLDPQAQLPIPSQSNTVPHTVEGCQDDTQCDTAH